MTPVFLILLALFDPHVHGTALGGWWSKILALALLSPVGAYLLLGNAVGYKNLADALFLKNNYHTERNIGGWLLLTRNAK